MKTPWKVYAMVGRDYSLIAQTYELADAVFIMARYPKTGYIWYRRHILWREGRETFPSEGNELEVIRLIHKRIVEISKHEQPGDYKIE